MAVATGARLREETDRRRSGRRRWPRRAQATHCPPPARPVVQPSPPSALVPTPGRRAMHRACPAASSRSCAVRRALWPLAHRRRRSPETIELSRPRARKRLIVAAASGRSASRKCRARRLPDRESHGRQIPVTSRHRPAREDAWPPHRPRYRSRLFLHVLEMRGDHAFASSAARNAWLADACWRGERQRDGCRLGDSAARSTGLRRRASGPRLSNSARSARPAVPAPSVLHSTRGASASRPRRSARPHGEAQRAGTGDDQHRRGDQEGLVPAAPASIQPTRKARRACGPAGAYQRAARSAIRT